MLEGRFLPIKKIELAAELACKFSREFFAEKKSHRKIVGKLEGLRLLLLPFYGRKKMKNAFTFCAKAALAALALLGCSVGGMGGGITRA